VPRRIKLSSKGILTEQLQELKGHGLVMRTVYAEVPSRVEYAATPLAESLRLVITAMDDWGLKYGDKIIKRSKA